MEKPICPRKNATVGSTDMTRHIGLLCAAALLTLSACTTTSKDNTIPHEGPTMEQVYRTHMGGTLDRGARFDTDIPRRSAGDVSPTAFTRTSLNETENRFGRLPNPDLVMYVFPHLAGNGSRYPVPGYTTVFPMYETVEYAMPGEVAPREAFIENLPYRGGEATKREASYHGPGERMGDTSSVAYKSNKRGSE